MKLKKFQLFHCYYFKNSNFQNKLFWEGIVTFFKSWLIFFQNDPLIYKWPPNENDPLNLKNCKWPPRGFWQKPPLLGGEDTMLLSLIKNHTHKRKLEAICALRGSKYGFKTIFRVWMPIFDPWGHKWSPIFVYVCDFQSVIKDKAFDISQGVFSVPIWKIEFFLPHFTVLPVFMKYVTAPKRAVGEKNWYHFRL